MRSNINIIFLYIIIFLSFIGGYFEKLIHEVYLASTISIAGISILLLVHIIGINNKFRADQKISVYVFILFCIYFLGIILHGKINSYLFFAISVASLVFIMHYAQLKRSDLLKITNLTYLIYLFFSIMVYINVLPQPRELNMFEYNYFGLDIKTFIGLYGSTSSIDSYSIIVLLLNLFYNKSSIKYFYIIVTAFFALATFRFTPYLIVILPFLILFFSRRLSKNFQQLAIIPFYISFLIPLFISYIFESKVVDILINGALNGRAFLWNDMISEYNEQSILSKLFGFGDSSDFLMFTWNTETDNPHNVFLATLINYGMIPYILLGVVVLKKFPYLIKKNQFLLLAIFSAGIGNSIIFSVKNIAIVIWILYCIMDSENNKNEKDISSRSNTSSLSWTGNDDQSVSKC